MFGFRMPTRVLIEPGSIHRLPEALRTFQFHRPLLVVDQGVLATPWAETVQGILSESGLDPVIFDEVEVNPRTTTVEKAAAMIRDEGADGVLALGGGSVLDAGKAAAMMATNDGVTEHYEGRDRYPNAPLPFVAVPTTCGTGSEVTWVSVLTLDSTRVKISVKGESMFPNQALVDANLIKTLPSHMVASTGLDALTHALEATTGGLANTISNALAEKSIALLLRFLKRAVEDVEGDTQAREAVMRASTLAGLAFGNADVAGVHCLSESLGGMHDVPHGACNAIILTPMMRYHGESVQARLAALELLAPQGLREAPEAERAESFLARIETLVRDVEIPAFSSFNVPRESYEEVARNAVQNGSNGSNPQPMAQADYLKILESLA